MRPDPRNDKAPPSDEALSTEWPFSATTATNHRRAARHHRRAGTFYGYRTTDAVLFHPWLSPAEKLVLAAVAAHPRRSPSHRYLQAFVPIDHDKIEQALSRIEQVFGIVEESWHLAARIVIDLPFIYADLLLCARDEMALHLSDLLRRRVPLLILARLSEAEIRHLADLVSSTMGWDAGRIELEIGACRP